MYSKHPSDLIDLLRLKITCLSTLKNHLKMLNKSLVIDNTPSLTDIIQYFIELSFVLANSLFNFLNSLQINSFFTISVLLNSINFL